MAIATAAETYGRAGSTTEGHTLAISLSASAAASCLVPVDDVATFKLASVAAIAQRAEAGDSTSGTFESSIETTMPSLDDASLQGTRSVREN